MRPRALRACGLAALRLYGYAVPPPATGTGGRGKGTWDRSPTHPMLFAGRWSLVPAPTQEQGTGSREQDLHPPDQVCGLEGVRTCGAPTARAGRGSICGVPSLTMLGAPSPVLRVPSGPNIVTGGTLGARVRERAPRVSDSRRERQTDDSASCGVPSSHPYRVRLTGEGVTKLRWSRRPRGAVRRGFRLGHLIVSPEISGDPSALRASG
jgi:hypothetical protein